NRAHNNMLVEQKKSPVGNIAYFEGGANSPEVLEAKQWLAAVREDKEPLVKPEQAFIVTKILDAIYESAETGKEVVFNN
ncbi:Gfo/Idh/MocA family oxidoreductase, partial [Niallia taxi]|uniref:Gfo/Idh/MocA family oxidoreductase n=1 Tax=Niallia taxi TaxID=2499688 RepID=UPI00217567B8